MQDTTYTHDIHTNQHPGGDYQFWIPRLNFLVLLGCGHCLGCACCVCCLFTCLFCFRVCFVLFCFTLLLLLLLHLLLVLLFVFASVLLLFLFLLLHAIRNTSCMIDSTIAAGCQHMASRIEMFQALPHKWYVFFLLLLFILLFPFVFSCLSLLLLLLRLVVVVVVVVVCWQARGNHSRAATLIVILAK